MNFSVEKFKDLEGYLENLSIEKQKKDFLNKNFCKSTEENILIVYDNIDTNQIFGAPEIERIEEQHENNTSSSGCDKSNKRKR